LHDAMVFTDEELLLRVLRNLLTNAVQFTEFGEVRCITQMRGDRVEFIVSDTGCGIPPEQHAEVFREFVRVTPKGQTSSGAGLGLSIVAKIDQALRLDLHMTSTVGVGTQFSFSLPAAAEVDFALTPRVLPPAT
jgi:two-component system sensor histidine kinase ChiS